MNVPFLDLRAQYQSIRHEIDKSIQEVIDKTAFILGDAVSAFEKNFAHVHGTAHCVAVNSGTSALHLALLASGIKPGDEVITVPMTFVATVEAILMANAVPVFVDVDPRTLLMDTQKLTNAISQKTKAIIPVHLYGQIADMDPINQIARAHGIRVIEDACQAHMAVYKGRRAGGIGDLGCFSFYPGKNLGAYGEGGAVTTNNADWAQQMRWIRDHGQSEKYRHVVLGYNYRMDGIQGAVLGTKLPHLEQWTAQRRACATWYKEGLNGLPLDLPIEEAERMHVFHLYSVRTPRRDELKRHLENAEIGVGLHYPIPVHQQPAFANESWAKGSYPVTETASSQVLSLPMYPELTRQQVDYVCQHVRSFFGK